MSKSRPDKKKARRRYQNEIRKLQREHSQRLTEQYNIDQARQNKIEELTAQVEELRITLRDLGDDHSLKRCIPNHDGSLISTARVNAREITFGMSARMKDEVEQMLVGKLANELVKKGYVRIETVYPRSYEDLSSDCVTITARIDVIPWYKGVKREMVYLDDDRISMTYKEGELV